MVSSELRTVHELMTYDLTYVLSANNNQSTTLLIQVQTETDQRAKGLIQLHCPT